MVYAIRERSVINSMDSSVKLVLKKNHGKPITSILGVLVFLGIIYGRYVYKRKEGTPIIWWVAIIIGATYLCTIFFQNTTILFVARLILVISCLLISASFYYYSAGFTKRKDLTIVITFTMIYIAMNIWYFTEELQESLGKGEGQDDEGWETTSKIRWWIIVVIISIFTLIKEKGGVGGKIYYGGTLALSTLFFLYNMAILVRKYTIFSKYTDYIFPLILFFMFALYNYQDFNKSTLDTKFVYVLGFVLTMFLLFIITNTNDMKIKTFVTIFLVVVYNILAILYGNKDCSGKVSSFTLLKRIIKWSILVLIITLILWNNHFQTSIGDQVQSVASSEGGIDRETETESLQESLDRKKGTMNTQIREGDRSDERVQLQSEINRLYEKRARDSL